MRTDPVILPSLRPANYCRVLINVKVDKEKDNLDAMTIVKVLLVWVLVESFFCAFPLFYFLVFTEVSWPLAIFLSILFGELLKVVADTVYGFLKK